MRTAVLVALLLTACARVGAVSVQPLPVEAPAATERPFRMGFTTERADRRAAGKGLRRRRCASSAQTATS